MTFYYCKVFLAIIGGFIMLCISWNVAWYRADLLTFLKVFILIFCLARSKVEENSIDYHPDGYYRYQNVAQKMLFWKPYLHKERTYFGSIWNEYSRKI